MFNKIKGQNGALSNLKAAIANERVAQAYLFHGSPGTGKFTTALSFGMALNCLAQSEYRPCGQCSSCRKFLALDHPDLLYVFPTPNLSLSPEGEIGNREAKKEYDEYVKLKRESPWEQYRFSTNTMIRIESVNWLIRRLSLSVHEARRRLCLIENADQMNIDSQNAFLKTLEEPPADTVIILISSQPSRLLPTVVSRCQPLRFQSLAPRVIEDVLCDDFHIPREQARAAAHISAGNLKRAIRFAQNESSELRAQAFEILQLAADGKDLALFRNIQALPRQFTAESAIGVLRYVTMFIGDLALIEDAPEQIVNIDKESFLTTLRERLASLDPAEIGDRALVFTKNVEDYIHRLQGNVNPRLVMMNLCLDLKTLLTS
ncbi:MAG: DNA polymerase III subunit delta' [Candidatus Cloacimonadaceae bacterium]|jgi:DNA polymerase-3 subunit delta'|nr:DNA polymerase III subunit delta' [Candidatus Cloacimonadota bacterium]MDX9949758.1 DNA polymerase III subunit delta' [Candidatus Syntrophosphaera sp.]